MKMFLEIMLLIICIAIFVCLFFYLLHPVISSNSPRSLSSSVCFGKNCFQVELAKTGAEQEKGLMYRTSLDKNKGMLFIFNKEGFYPFWMKDTLIPLDMVWIDGNNKVVFIAQNVQPCKSLICPSVFPWVKAKYVLEVNAGICNEISLKIGDTLNINAD